MFIPKLIGLSFAFLTLIIPRYIDYLPEYVYLSSFKKTEELKDDVLSNNEKIIILQNQKMNVINVRFVLIIIILSLQQESD